MIQRRKVIGPGARGLVSALVVVAALVLAGPVGAVAPPPRPLPEEQGPPLFEGAAGVVTDPFRMTVSVVGAGAAPVTGRWAALATVYAGEHPRVASWKLETPLTNRWRRMNIGTATLVLNGFQGSPGLGAALAELVTLKAGDEFLCWSLQDTDIFHPLPRRWVNVIRDGEIPAVGSVEAAIYSAVVVRANFTSAKAFNSAVRADITLTHLLEDPESYRGQVVRVEGKLQKINRFDPPFEASQGGVNDLYEAWISLGSHPYRVVFTEWPAGLSRKYLGKDRISDGPVVRAEGYFYKLLKGYRYKVNRRDVERDVPLLIGHTLRIPGAEEQPSEASGTGWVKTLVFGFLGLFAALVFGVIGLTYWYRKSDNDLRKRLLKARAPEFILPPPDATPIAPLAAPVGRGVPGPAMPPRLNLPTGPVHRPVDRPEEEGGESSGDRPPDEGAGP